MRRIPTDVAPVKHIHGGEHPLIFRDHMPGTGIQGGGNSSMRDSTAWLSGALEIPQGLHPEQRAGRLTFLRRSW